MPVLPLPEIDKTALLAALIDELASEVRQMAARARATAASATHAESRAEDSKDTRAIEESYLARGQAERVAEVQLDLAMLRSLRPQSFVDRPIAATALVEIEDDDGATRTVLMVPRAGGRKIEFGGRSIALTTPASPLGRALLGATEGDEFELAGAKIQRAWTIAEVV